MTNIVSFGQGRSDLLSQRRSVPVDLPAFILRALEYRVALVNADAAPDARVTLNDVIEWYLVSSLSIKEVPGLEGAVPGFAGALATWLFENNYQPPE